MDLGILYMLVWVYTVHCRQEEKKLEEEKRADT